MELIIADVEFKVIFEVDVIPKLLVEVISVFLFWVKVVVLLVVVLLVVVVVVVVVGVVEVVDVVVGGPVIVCELTFTQNTVFVCTNVALK